MNAELGNVKKADVQIPTITPTDYIVQIRLDNERLFSVWRDWNVVTFVSKSGLEDNPVFLLSL